MKKQIKKECQYCGEGFKNLGQHLRFCKVKKNQFSSWNPVSINWEQKYKELESKFNELIRKNDSQNIALRDSKEALMKMCQAVHSCIEATQ